MSIRLNKALRELNIGLQTAVEFLENRKELGEIKPELSYKLSDDQYKVLEEAFKQDAEVRNQADKISFKKPKEKKPTHEHKESRGESLLEPTKQPQFKPLGKIDLSTVGKKPAAKASVAPETKTTPEAKTAAVSHEPKKEPTTVEHKKKEDTQAPKAKPAENTHAKHNEEKQPQKATPKVAQEKPANDVKPVEATTEKAEEKTVSEKPAESHLYQLKSERKVLNTPNVVGKIDLASINQSTRPKKKTKEERKKEREDKAQAQHPGGERKKRTP